MMKKNHRFLHIVIAAMIFVFAGSVVNGLAADDPQKILADIQKHHGGINTLSAEYSRVTRTAAMENLFQSSAKQTAKGQLLFKKPAKLRLDQVSPRQEKMVTDGRTVWWYVPDKKLVRRYSNVDVYGELKPLLDFLGGIGSLEGHFSIKVTPAWTGTEVNHRLDLNRLQQRTGPAAITVWFNPKDYSLAGFRLISRTGEKTDFSLRNVQMNVSLNDSSFTFDIPSGVEVVDEPQKKNQ